MTSAHRAAVIMALILLAGVIVAGMTVLSYTDHDVPEVFGMALTGILAAVAALFVPRKGNE